MRPDSGSEELLKILRTDHECCSERYAQTVRPVVGTEDLTCVSFVKRPNNLWRGHGSASPAIYLSVIRPSR